MSWPGGREEEAVDNRLSAAGHAVGYPGGLCPQYRADG